MMETRSMVMVAVYNMMMMAMMLAMAMTMATMMIMMEILLLSSIDVGGGDHFGGADPDATPIDDGEVTRVAIASIFASSFSISPSLSVKYS